MARNRGVLGMYPPRSHNLRNGAPGFRAVRGPLGMDDSAPASMLGPLGIALAAAGGPDAGGAAAVAPAGTPADASTVDDKFEFGGKKFKKTKRTLQQCYDRLPSKFPADFLKNVKKTVADMYGLGFAFAPAPKGGFRTFQQQYDVPSTATKAGPGESFHNYAIAVDLGCWQWIDEKGDKHDKDWWLAMKGTAYDGCDGKIWDKRDEFAKANSLAPLSSERIHLQAVAANKSGSKVLCALLNEVAKNNAAGSKYKYQTKYKCDLGCSGDYYNIGTAKQMWAGSSAVTDADIKKAFPDLSDEERTAKKKAIIQNIKKDMQLAGANWKQAVV